MKRIGMLLMAAIALIAASCSSDKDFEESNPEEIAKLAVKPVTPSQAFAIAGTDTIAASGKIATRGISELVQTDDAYFFIRIDSRIPTAEKDGKTFSSKSYFPQTASGRSYFGTENKGKVNLEYAYKNGTSTVPSYVFSSEGKSTIDAILSEIPTLESLFSGDKSGIELGDIDLDSLKVIWYVVKYQTGTGDEKWHVDGVLTYKSTGNIYDIPDFIVPDGYEDDDYNNGSVEVNFSYNDEQDNGDYIATKLSVHVRDTTDFEIFIPVEEEFYCRQDDMFIVKTHQAEQYVYNENYAETLSMQIGDNTVTLTVTYKPEGIYVKSEGINADVLKICRELYFDGLTFEVWNYFNSNIDRAALKAKLDEKTTVSFTQGTEVYVNSYPGDNDMKVTPVQKFSETKEIEEPRGTAYIK